MKRYEFLGYPVDSITTKEALTQIDNYIAENKPHRITPINASKLCMVDSNNRIADIISKSDMIIPEYAVVWGANKLKIRLAEHIGGIMLMRSILENAPKKNYSIYFLGAKQEVIGAMIRKIMDDYPSLKIAGHHHGYFTPKEDEKIIKDIRESKPDVLLVALGSPKQEIWV
ncbi:MAG: WecB/TagA/CpsF family glycosyltransferase, partial [candidate division Zixibacteria bacterium]|nr:WecB/TagA/CpsF family glycosyltransferase [candidate division Zixibacteria bacterium]